MTRKKPYSNKQKKVQLQLQRQRKKQKREQPDKEEDDPFIPTTGEDNEKKEIKLASIQPTKRTGRKKNSNGGGRGNSALKKLPADLRTVFESEPRSVIEQRKLDSDVPIVRGREHLLRTQDTNLYSAIIDLPKRPPWSNKMTAEQVESNEERYFEQWMRAIYEHPISRLNYFEHNLQVWRQLWRVCEMSDVLVLVADIRHPLFHFPPSLYDYVTNYHKKPLILLLNKIDLVSAQRVKKWKKYFEKTYPQLHVIPFSTHTELKHVTDEFTVKHKRLKKGKLSARYLGARGGAGLIQAILELAFPDDSDEPVLTEEEIERFEYQLPESTSDSDASSFNYQPPPEAQNSLKPDDDNQIETEPEEEPEEDVSEEEENVEEESEEEAELCAYNLKSLQEVETESKDSSIRTTRKYRVIGMIGHPNVGKSSLINGMKRKKVVSTSRTPGHTKHFQTIFLTEQICLCDCPGLVFPALDMKKELQVLCGLYPIAQVREPYSAIRYLAERVRVEEIYKLDPPPDEDQYTRDTFPWSGRNIAQCYAIKRGYRSKGGREDSYRAGLEILKDTLDGVIILAFDPPLVAEEAESGEVNTKIPEICD